MEGTLKGFDIIGDVHGCAAKLKALLRELGYRRAEGRPAPLPIQTVSRSITTATPRPAAPLTAATP